MTIKQYGGIFGRHPEFATVGGVLTTAAQPNITSLGVQATDLAFAAGKGIDFSGIGTSAEILDDYEEGLFYPSLTCATTGFASITQSHAGEYIRVGRVVHIYIYYRVDALSKGSPSGNITLKNLPFVVQDGNTPNGRPRGYSSMVISSSSAAPFGGAAVPLAAHTFPGTDYITFYKRSAVDGATTTMTDADVGSFSGTRVMNLSGSYYTT
jgi:hypothetical protein